MLPAKLKALKPLLKIWNVASFGNIVAQKNKALNLLNQWDKEELTRQLINQELEERNSACDEYKRWALMKEVSWRQKSRELWLREGDKNTKFFHKMANARRRRNSLVKVKIKNGWLIEEGEIKEAVIGAFLEFINSLQ